MKSLFYTVFLLAFLLLTPDIHARGFGRAGGGAAVGRYGGVASGGYRGSVGVGPYGGYHSSFNRGGSYVSPYGGYGAGGSRGGSYVTPGGTRITGGAAGGVRVGPAGGVHAGGASGVRVTTPGGRTYTSGQRGGVAVGPGGAAVSGGSRGTIATGPGGVYAGGSRGGVAVGPYGGAVGGVTRGGYATGGRAVVGHSSYYVNPTNLATRGWYVRGTGYTYFNRSWYTAHPVAWRPYRWAASNYWVAPAWGVLAPWCGIVATAPMYDYDYGSNVVFTDNNVYYDGENLGSADAYAQQAIDYSNQGRDNPPAEKDDFQSLGVFGMIEGDEKTAQHIFQLGVNKSGIVRGNYYNALTDQSTPVYGSVDKKSQRVCWSVGDKKDIVFEAGLGNLTKEQTTALVHYGKEKTIQMILVRLKESTDSTKE